MYRNKVAADLNPRHAACIYNESRCIMKTLPTLLAVALFAPLAQAQQHYANIQPQVPQKATQSDIVSNGLSGRDPFQLNWSTPGIWGPGWATW